MKKISILITFIATFIAIIVFLTIQHKRYVQASAATPNPLATIDEGIHSERLLDIARKAKAGNVEAQLKLSDHFSVGDGVEKNPEKAFLPMSIAAEQENTLAQAQLGAYYYQGVGTKQDFKKAHHFFSAAAAKNDPCALYGLGLLYYHGHNVEIDYKKAYTYFKRSAALNFPPGQIMVGCCYYYGQGVTQDVYKAQALIDEAMEDENFSEETQLEILVLLAMMHYNERASSFTQSEALRLAQQLSEKNHPGGKFILAQMYNEGKALPKDQLKAFHLYHTLAVDHQEAPAAFELTKMYYHGEGVPQNLAEAERHLLFAINAVTNLQYSI